VNSRHAGITGKIIKNDLGVFKKSRKFATKWCITLCVLDKAIFFERGLPLKGLMKWLRQKIS